MTDMRRYLDILGGAPDAPAAPPAAIADADMAYDDFGPSVPMTKLPAAPVAPPAAPPAPAMTTTVTMGQDGGGHMEEMHEMCKRLLAKIAHHVKELAPVMLQGGGEIEPWMQDKLSQAAEALEAVAEYATLDADDILVLMAEGQGKAAKVMEARQQALDEIATRK